VETIKAERDATESELTSATVDMKSKFLNAPSVSMQCLWRVWGWYGPLQCQVQKEEDFVADVQVSYRSTAITLLHFTNYSFNVLNLGIFKVLTALLLKIFVC